jgi:hypothetical protein
MNFQEYRIHLLHEINKLDNIMPILKFPHKIPLRKQFIIQNQILADLIKL